MSRKATINIGGDEFELKPQHRPKGDIAGDIADKDEALNAIKAKAKSIADGYKVQVEDLTADLDRLRDEYRAAKIALGERVS